MITTSSKTKVFIVLSITFLCSVCKMDAQTNLMFGLGINAHRSIDYWDQFGGGGLSLSAEINNNRLSFFSLELKGKFYFYSYKQKDDLFVNDDLQIRFYPPSICLNPKISVKLTDELKIQLENEFAINYCYGYVNAKRSFGKNTFKGEALFSYTPVISLRGDIGKAEASIGVGYSTLNFGKTVNKYIPDSYGVKFKDLRPDLLLTITFYFLNVKL